MMIKIATLASLAACTFCAASCAHEVSGAGLFLNMQPAAPTFAAQYDFDFRGQSKGEACAVRDEDTEYWFSGVKLDDIKDATSRQAVAAAIASLLDYDKTADSFVLTRAVAIPKGEDKVCATVWGHPVRLRKARPASPPTVKDPSELVEPEIE